jgi:hypothetical protein
MTRPSPQPPSLAGADWLSDARLQRVLAALSADGGEARIAGGTVRNALLDEPVSDMDVATTEVPTRVVELARRAGLEVHPTGLDHGTVTVVAKDGDGPKPFEVTTLRIDVETYGRHAQVAFTDDWTADARRRDFTMNALYCDGAGTVFDPVGGFPDILERRVRFVGEPQERIREDFLRILRFFRFQARYGQGDPDADGLAACVALQEGLETLSAERVRQEMLKLLVAPGAVPVLRVMVETGIAARILPTGHDLARVARMAGIDAEQGLEPDPVLRLAASPLHGRTMPRPCAGPCACPMPNTAACSTSPSRSRPPRRCATTSAASCSTRWARKLSRCGPLRLVHGPGRVHGRGLGRTAAIARALDRAALSGQRGGSCQPRRSGRPGNGAASQASGGLVDGRRVPRGQACGARAAGCARRSPALTCAGQGASRLHETSHEGAGA